MPSIFEPAPYVDLVAESPSHDLIGSNYTMYLGGDVAGRSFFIELETPTGVVWAEAWVHDNSTTNATFEANFTLLGGHNYLYPGLYIVHIHDSCVALLYSKRVTLAYPTIASIQILTMPSSCGTVTLNGTAYSNDQFANVVPSPNPYTFGFSGCKGFAISNYTYVGAIHIVGSRLMVVSANGTFTANYRPTAPVVSVTPGQGPVGAIVTVSGTGFSALSPVALVFDNVTITTCVAGSSLTTGVTGSFNCTFTVPTGTSGTSVIATDVGGQTATGTFKVTTPWVGISPKPGPVGAVVTVSGTGFSALSPVALVFDNVTITTCVGGSLTTGVTGSFNCTITVPTGTSGTSVVATNGYAQIATSTFTVTTPKITIDPKQGPTNAATVASGTGFSVSSVVGLVFDNVTVTSCTSGSLTTGVTGSFNCAFTVPTGTSGTSVIATDVGGQTATGTFKVTTPWVGISPKPGPVGAVVTVSGTGFSALSPVALVFDNVTITTCVGGSLTTGVTGSFNCTITVPTGTSGTMVTATDIGGRSVTVTFKVTTPSITVNPKKGLVSAAVTVSGTGFSVSSVVGLVFDNVTVTSCTSGSLTTGVTGSFNCTFTVPTGTSGTSVIATDVGGQTATGTFVVLSDARPRHSRPRLAR
jgi:hypothetical protein